MNLIRLDRRSLLKLGGAALISGGDVGAAGKEPAIRFPTDPRGRLAVASYPFRDYIQHPGAKPRPDNQRRMPLTEFPAMVVKRFQLRNTEPLSRHFESRDSQYLKRLREAHEKAGARVVNIPFSAKGNLSDPDPAARARAVADARGWIDAAVAIGSPSVRSHVGGSGGAKPDFDRTVDSLRQLAAYGQEKDVVVNLENDDPKTEEAGFLVSCIERVGSPWLRALPDFCNSMLLGDADYNYRSVQAMFRHAYNISHVKDSEVDEGKVYRVDVARTFKIAKSTGYRGYFSMEWEGQADPFTGTQQLIDESLRNLTS